MNRFNQALAQAAKRRGIEYRFASYKGQVMTVMVGHFDVGGGSPVCVYRYDPRGCRQSTNRFPLSPKTKPQQGQRVRCIGRLRGGLDDLRPGYEGYIHYINPDTGSFIVVYDLLNQNGQVHPRFHWEELVIAI